MIDKDTGEILEVYKSGTEAGRYIQSLNLTTAKHPNNSIYDVCRGRQDTAFGYKWQYADKNLIISEEKNND